MSDANKAAAVKLDLGYTAPLNKEPKTKQEGLSNALQMIINAIEAGENREALLLAVGTLDDVASKSNPYRIGSAQKRKPASNYMGDVNTD